MHKLLEEVLTGETVDRVDALEIRARDLLAQLGIPEADRPEDGPARSRAGGDDLAGPGDTRDCRVPEPVGAGNDRFLSPG